MYSRGTTRDPIRHGYRQKLQKHMADIKKYLIDIAHASHHLDYLTKAAASNKLPRGLTVEPRMMLVDADDEMEAEWREQTRLNTLAYIQIAIRHYNKVITRKTGQIAEKQKAVLECITDRRLLNRQTEESIEMHARGTAEDC